MLQLIACLLVPNLVSAENQSKQVIRYGLYAGNINRFPDTKGIGWSNSIPYEIFTAAGIEVKIIELPAERLPVAFAQGEIDSFVRSKESLKQYDSNFLPSAYPLATIAWQIYYDTRKGWQPTWPPDEEFKQKIGRSKQSANDLKAAFALNISQGSSFDSIFRMVNRGRADYWIDNRSGMRSFTPESGISIPQGFAFEPIFLRGVYLILQDDERGRHFHQVLDKGMKELIANGDYAKVYYMNDNFYRDNKTVVDTMTYIRQKFPDHNVPVQKLPR